MLDDDPNHFCPEYVRGKKLIANPDTEALLGCWPLVARECQTHGMDVRNASPGSALTCFPTLDFDCALNWVTTVREVRLQEESR
jgi:hypothetical protein